MDRSADNGPLVPKLRLTLVAGELDRQSFEFEEAFSIGRGRDSAIRVPSTRISRSHCVVEPTEKGWILRDEGSRNGTFVNGEPVREHELASGDRVSVSAWGFEVRLLGALAEPSGGWTRVEAAATEELSVEQGLYFAPQELARGGADARSLDLLLRLARQLPGLGSASEVRDQALALLLEGTTADRVSLFGVSSLEGSLDLELWRAGAPLEKRPVHETVIESALDDRRAVLSQEVAGGEGSLLAVPLMLDAERSVGALYLESLSPSRQLDTDHLRFVTAFAGMLAPVLASLRYRLWLEGRAKPTERGGLVGESQTLRRTLAQVERAAASEATVLLCGESGTGKELVARALHRGSPREGRPFVAVNCAALTDSLLESELFGHERGAFTGADRRRVGRFELADGGTLFLDEIGEMALQLQPKLLRVLEERELERVGGTATVKVDVRIVAATNRDLALAVERGEFRSDLYYRLNVVSLELPPLRDRVGDVGLLARYFVRQAAERLGRPGLELSSTALAALDRHAWPGNVRELRNAIERAAVLAVDDVIEVADLPEEIAGGRDVPLSANATEAEGYREIVRSTKERLIRDAVEAAEGNVSEAARGLGLSPNYLHRLITQLGLRDD